MSRSNSTRRRAPRRGLRARRGIALFVAMFFVAGVGALALSAIYLTANATLLGKSYEKEDDLKYVSEAALAIGKAELNFNPAALPLTGWDTLMLNKTLTAADGQPVSGISVNLYAGPSGLSGTGEFGRFASVVAEARDANGTGFVRRLELTQESFAKYAYWTNSEGGGSIAFGGGDQLWGPVWSNDIITIASSGATFHDAVGTAMTISGASNGTFAHGYQINQRAIALPSLSTLSTLSTLAATGGMSHSAGSTGNETTVLTRIEFLATSMHGSPSTDSIGDNEGFYRVYTANANKAWWLRADWPAGTPPTAPSLLNCGDWHPDTPGGVLKFFPASVHRLAWFDTVYAGSMTGGTLTSRVTAAHTEGQATVGTILGHQGARCYLGGDPHLAAVTRDAAHGYPLAKMHIGGTDTTFTPTDSLGHWVQYSATPPATMTTARGYDAKYLVPLYRGFNTNTKGVIYFNGTVGVSGVVRGSVTLYSPNTVVILDDIRYATDPAARTTSCPDILGIISGAQTVVADNSINTPQIIGTSPTVYSTLDDSPDLYIHSVIMALGNSFTVQNYTAGPTTQGPCQGTPWGRGCLFLTGGLIQNTRGAVAQSSGTGFLKRYSYDRCAIANPPPYFPTTGRFQDNRYEERDPVNFSISHLFATLTREP